MAVAGVDVWAGRWVAVVVDTEGKFRTARTAGRIDVLVSGLRDAAEDFGEQLDLVAIDIPIGLPEFESRTADLRARAALGIRRSSLFLTPVRVAVQEADYHCANRLQRERTGSGMSKQAHALRAGILDVDRWLAGTPQVAAIEVHLELSFAQMTGAPMARAKRTWSGLRARLAALDAEGIDPPADLGPAGMAAADDLIDAAAAAWTARRHRVGAAVCYPPAGEVMPDEPKIWA